MKIGRTFASPGRGALGSPGRAVLGSPWDQGFTEIQAPAGAPSGQSHPIFPCFARSPCLARAGGLALLFCAVKRACRQDRSTAQNGRACGRSRQTRISDEKRGNFDAMALGAPWCFIIFKAPLPGLGRYGKPDSRASLSTGSPWATQSAPSGAWDVLSDFQSCRIFLGFRGIVVVTNSQMNKGRQ